MTKLKWLLFNHGDAWGVTFGICFMAMLFHAEFSGRAWLLAGGTALGYWMGFALNDYFDAPDDATDPKKRDRNFFALAEWPHWKAGVLFGTTFCVVLWIFAQYSPWGVPIFGLSIFAMWAYSAPPIRFKYRPGWDLLSHMLFVESYPYLVFMLLLGLPWLPVDWLIYSLLLLASLSAQLEQQLRDYEVDKANGNSFTVLVGRPVSNKLLQLVSVVVVTVLACGLIWQIMPLYMLPMACLALPILIHRSLGKARETGRLQRTGTVILVLGIAYLTIIARFVVA